MAEIRINHWLLNIEKEKTKALYATQLRMDEDVHYQSFHEANQILDADLLHFSNTLGLDLQLTNNIECLSCGGRANYVQWLLYGMW